MINYFFYKNFMYVMPIFLFGVYSVFSGTNFYDNVMYNFFNVFFTGLPIIWYGVFDWQFEKETLLVEPAYYKLGL